MCKIVFLRKTVGIMIPTLLGVRIQLRALPQYAFSYSESTIETLEKS